MKEKILEILENNEYISGEKIAKKLNVTRTAIWKQINSLKKDGYQIKSKKSKGYSLTFKPDKPYEYEIKKGLKTKRIGKKIFYFHELESTNTFIKKKLKDGIKEGTLVISDIQTEGRGRKKREWNSPEGGLWFSIILYPELPPGRGMILTMAASISIVQAIKQNFNLNPKIKWPNDILINNKKICGILTELDAEIDKINYAIIGIGINVNNEVPFKFSQKAASIKEFTRKKVSRIKLLHSILETFDKEYELVLNGYFSQIRNQWIEYSDIFDKEIEIKTEKEVFFGKVIDIDETGCLLIRSNNEVLRVVSGDITYI